MLRAILNKSWIQHPTKQQLYVHLLPITKTVKVWQTRHAGHCWRSRDELIRDVLLWTPSYSRAKAGRPARTYIQQLFEDTGCSPEDLPEAINDREKWRERDDIYINCICHVKSINSTCNIPSFSFGIELLSSQTIYIYIYMYIYHHVVLQAWISCHFSLSFIATGRFLELHPI